MGPVCGGREGKEGKKASRGMAPFSIDFFKKIEQYLIKILAPSVPYHPTAPSI
jgi:hypothetical protein